MDRRKFFSVTGAGAAAVATRRCGRRRRVVRTAGAETLRRAESQQPSPWLLRNRSTETRKQTTRHAIFSLKLTARANTASRAPSTANGAVRTDRIFLP